MSYSVEIHPIGKYAVYFLGGSPDLEPVNIQGINTIRATWVMTTGGDDHDRTYTWNHPLVSVQEIIPEIALVV